MRVEEVDTPGADWAEFAAAHPQANLGHAPEWITILKQGYKLRTRALIARRGLNEVAGVLRRRGGSMQWAELLASAGNEEALKVVRYGP